MYIFNHILFKACKQNKTCDHGIFATFKSQRQVWDDYGMITTFNKNDKYGMFMT